MNKLVLDYIREEKDISRYKLSLLRKGEEKQYKSRLISLEKEFIEYPFEKLGLTTIDLARKALSDFRADREDFFSKYEKTPAKKAITKYHRNALLDRLSFYNSTYKNLIETEISRLNIVENKEFAEFIGAEKLIEPDSSCGIDYILSAEGAYASKQRARVQILMYCLARFVFNKSKAIKKDVSEASDLNDYTRIKGSLEGFFENLEPSLFEYFNEGIREVPLIINGTLGHNSFIPTVYPLKNIISPTSGELYLERLLSSDKNFFTERGTPIRKRFVERGFGMLTNLSRLGNEALHLLHLDVWSSRGVRLTPIFEHTFFNYNQEGRYIKAVASIPVWEWGEKTSNAYLERELMGFLGLDHYKLATIKGLEKSMMKDINKTKDKRLRIDPCISKIMVSATRTEESNLLQAKKYVMNSVNKIELEYKKLFSKKEEEY